MIGTVNFSADIKRVAAAQFSDRGDPVKEVSDRLGVSDDIGSVLTGNGVIGAFTTDPSRMANGNTTKMTGLRERPKRGERLYWKPRSFIAGQQDEDLAATWVINGPKSSDLSELYIEYISVRTRNPATSSLSMTPKPTGVKGLRQSCGSATNGFYSCRPTARFSIPSKWPPPNSRRIFVVSGQEATMP